MLAAARADAFPVGGSTTVAELDDDPYSLLAKLREREPVSWVPALDAWLVTRRDLAVEVMSDAATFTVDDPRFSTALIVGRSMLSTDGAEHARHRAPFARPFRLDAVRDRFTSFVAREVDRLLDEIEPAGQAELRRSVAGPLAVAAMVEALGLVDVDPPEVLAWYDSIVAAVTDLSAGRAIGDVGPTAFTDLRDAVIEAIDLGSSASLLGAATDGADRLSEAEVVSNTAVLLFGGIETTEGMIANTVLHLLAHPDQQALVERDASLLAGAVEESLRLEPAAAVVDRYTTRTTVLSGARIECGELVRVSLTGANRDPAVFPSPDRFDVRRANANLNLAFARGPHVCVGMHLARLETLAVADAVLRRLRHVRLDAARPSVVRGLVFRKPEALHVVWG
jgi:cytochrome P450